jgi:SAM domain (Sterile alpha motif)
MCDALLLLLHRCGLRMHTAALVKYGIDGALLLTLDPSDLVQLGMTNPLHVKRLLLGIERRPQASARSSVIVSA